MKIIFFGTSGFAVAGLKAIFNSRHKILAVVTAADKKSGRGQRLSLSPVKEFAQASGLPVLQPLNLQESGFLNSLQAYCADAFAVCSYGKILTKQVLQIPRECAINLHASLLPKYRGAAPINWAIINGETQAGVTTIRMNPQMDAGEMILQRSLQVFPQDTAISLSYKLAQLGALSFVETFDLLQQKKAVFLQQDQKQVSFAPKLKKEDGLIDWQWRALDIHNRIRGLQPWPGAFSYFKGSRLKFWSSQVFPQEGQVKPGQVIGIDRQTGILIQTGQGALLITMLQLEAKKKMSAAEFILGHRIKIGDRIEKCRGKIKKRCYHQNLGEART